MKKYIIFLLFPIILFSCSNEKHKIEERIKFVNEISNILNIHKEQISLTFDTLSFISDLSFYKNQNQRLINKIDVLKVPNNDQGLISLKDKSKNILTEFDKDIDEYMKNYKDDYGNNLLKFKCKINQRHSYNNYIECSKYLIIEMQNNLFEMKRINDKK